MARVGCLPAGNPKTRSLTGRPARTPTQTRENPYPYAGVRVRRGWGTGYIIIPGGYPCRTLTTTLSNNPYCPYYIKIRTLIIEGNWWLSDSAAATGKPDALTRHQSVYMRERAKSAHLSASAVEQRSDATDRAGDPADEAREDWSGIQMIGPSIRNRKGAL